MTADASVTPDAPVTPDAATLDATAVGDGAPDAVAPPVVPCANPLGLQPGSPWPIARRCPARAGYTDVTCGPTGMLLPWLARAPPSEAGATGSWQADLVIAADGTIYAYDPAAGVVALKPDSTQLWVAPIPVGSAPAGRAPPATSLAIGVDGTVYAYNGDLTALRPNGSITWTTQVTSYPNTPAGVTLQLTVGPDGTIYVVDTEDAPPDGGGHVFAFSSMGQMLWETTLGPGLNPYSSPSVGAGGAIYVVAVDWTGARSLMAFTRQGGLAWSAGTGTADPSPPSAEAFDDPPVIGPDGTVYAPCGPGAGSSGTSALCSFTADGTPLATFSTNPHLWGVTVSPSNARVYASTLNELEAFATDGTLLWTSPNVDQTSPIVDAQGMLFVNELWFLTKVDTSGNAVWSIPYLTPSGAVYTTNMAQIYEDAALTGRGVHERRGALRVAAGPPS